MGGGAKTGIVGVGPWEMVDHSIFGGICDNFVLVQYGRVLHGFGRGKCADALEYGVRPQDFGRLFCICGTCWVGQGSGSEEQIDGWQHDLEEIGGGDAGACECVAWGLSDYWGGEDASRKEW